MMRWKLEIIILNRFQRSQSERRCTPSYSVREAEDHFEKAEVVSFYPCLSHTSQDDVRHNYSKGGSKRAHRQDKDALVDE